MAELSLSEFADQVCEIIPVIAREFFSQASVRLLKERLTLPQFVVLGMLARQGEMKMTAIAQYLKVTTAAVTGIVDRLVRDGYAKRIRDMDDRRVIRINLTKRGSKVVSDIMGHRRRMVMNIFGMITQGEREEYLEILKHIRDHLKPMTGHGYE